MKFPLHFETRLLDMLDAPWKPDSHIAGTHRTPLEPDSIGIPTLTEQDS